MDLTFDRGSREEPKGHALLYFRSTSNTQEVWATYMVILPITVDVSKYVPPFLMNQVGELGPKDLSAFAFPPTPEQVESYAVLDSLAQQRDDDVLYAGDIDPNDVAQGMMSINEAVQEYAELYGRHAPALGAPQDEPDDEEEGAGVRDVLYELMSEGDKLEELTKMVGKLRFGVEGSDPRQVEEAEQDIRLLARHFPENHNIARTGPSRQGGRPSQRGAGGPVPAALLLPRARGVREARGGRAPSHGAGRRPARRRTIAALSIHRRPETPLGIRGGTLPARLSVRQPPTFAVRRRPAAC